MRGRKPKPTWLKEVSGNPGKRRLNPHEPKPNGPLNEPPEWFTSDQKAEWSYALANAPRGLLKRLDRSVLAIWIVAEDLHRYASQQIARFGVLTKAPHSGVPVQSPFLAILNKQAIIMLKAASELGFSPASRPRISVEPQRDRPNPFGDI